MIYLSPFLAFPDALTRVLVCLITVFEDTQKTWKQLSNMDFLTHSKVFVRIKSKAFLSIYVKISYGYVDTIHLRKVFNWNHFLQVVRSPSHLHHCFILFSHSPLLLFSFQVAQKINFTLHSHIYLTPSEASLGVAPCVDLHNEYSRTTFSDD